MGKRDRDEIALIREIVEKYRAELPSGSPMDGRINNALKTLDDMLKEKEELTVETPMGTMIAYVLCDPSNPGILIDLHRQGYESDAPLCMAEYTETEGDAEGPHLITRVWEDVRSMEYTDRIIHEKMDEFFRGEMDDE